jgi:xanthine dehydrogenase accessory factor
VRGQESTAVSDEAVLDQAERWLAEGRGVALATVVSTWGSAPRPVGSHLAVADGGFFAGSVSGGCIETAVIEGSRTVISDGQPRVLAFGVSDETAWSVGLPCGGEVRVLVERLGLGFAELQALRRERRPVARVVDTSDDAQALVTADSITGDLALAPHALAEARRMAAEDGSGFLSLPLEGGDGGGASRALGDAPPSMPPAREEDDRSALFLRSYGPPWELVIVGAVHIAQALAPMAAMAGFAVTVIDPRTGFAAPERFPGVTLVSVWPDKALAGPAIGPRTAVVTLTHDAKLDDPALAAALRSPAFHIGALGSRRTHAGRLERLTAAGFAPADLARIAGPVGLDIGARTPAEIAVAIAAELVAARRGRSR